MYLVKAKVKNIEYGQAKHYFPAKSSFSEFD